MSQNKILSRIERLESYADQSNGAEDVAYIDSVPEDALYRCVEYTKARIEIAGLERDPRRVLRKDPVDMSNAELCQAIRPGIAQDLELERPAIDALEAAEKPLTQDRAVDIASPLLAVAGLPESGFVAWLDSLSGVNYLRKVNGERPFHWYEFGQMQAKTA